MPNCPFFDDSNRTHLGCAAGSRRSECTAVGTCETQQRYAALLARAEAAERRVEELESDLDCANCIIEQALSDKKALRTRAHTLANEAQAQYGQCYADGFGDAEKYKSALARIVLGGE